MRRIRIPILLMLIPTAVLAANAHFITGPNFSVQNGAITVCGSIAGLGNQDVTIVVSATARTTCTNRGQNVPPGQTETLTGSVSRLRPENGRVNFCVTTDRASNPCPDGMRPQTTFSNVRVTVFQGGRQVLQQSFNP